MPASSTTDDDIEYISLFYLHNDANVNNNDEDGMTQEGFNISNDDSQTMDENDDQQREPTESNDESAAPRRYPE